MNLERPVFIFPDSPRSVAIAESLAAAANVSRDTLAEGKDAVGWAAEQALDKRPRVVVLPEQAVADRLVRIELLASGLLVRVGAEGGDSAETHVSIAETHVFIEDATVEAAVARVADLASSPPVVVALGSRTYAVEVAPGRAPELLERALLRLRPTRVVLVTDDVVAPLVLPRLERALRLQSDPIRVVLPTGERHKTLASIERVLRAAVEAAIDRGAVVVGVGGGVVTDMAGFAAAIALRGVRWVGLPTTLLSMVDASVGGKTGVDLGPAKNAVGAFHQPSAVIVDPSLTATESARGLRGGLAEVVKSALVGDKDLYRELVRPAFAEALVLRRDPAALYEAVRRSIAVKARIVSRDERESGERAHLNLGHTVGHALEAEGGFLRLTHGEAVSLGLVAALRVGVRLGITPASLASEVARCLGTLGLPVDLDQQPLESALRLVTFDKKKLGNALRFVLVRAPGEVQVVSVEPGRLPGLLVPLGG